MENIAFLYIYLFICVCGWGSCTCAYVCVCLSVMDIKFQKFKYISKMNPLASEIFFVFDVALKLFQKNKIAVQKGYMIIKK